MCKRGRQTSLGDFHPLINRDDVPHHMGWPIRRQGFSGGGSVDGGSHYYPTARLAGLDKIDGKAGARRGQEKHGTGWIG